MPSQHTPGPGERRLIAQAQALLEALEGAEDALTHAGTCQCCPGSSETEHASGCLLLRIRAAIAQAKGENNG